MSFPPIRLNCTGVLPPELFPAGPPMQPVLSQLVQELHKPFLQACRAEARFALHDLPFSDQAGQIFADVPAGGNRRPFAKKDIADDGEISLRDLPEIAAIEISRPIVDAEKETVFYRVVVDLFG